MHMDVSKNRGTPKSFILIGFSIINHPFCGSPIFAETPIYKDADSDFGIFVAFSSFTNSEIWRFPLWIQGSAAWFMHLGDHVGDSDSVKNSGSELLKFQKNLVGDFNPFEKYYSSQNGNLPQIGLKIKNICRKYLKPPPIFSPVTSGNKRGPPTLLNH